MPAARMNLQAIEGFTAVYKVEHWTDGREGTCLDCEVRLRWSQDGTGDIQLDWPTATPAVGTTPRKALRKLSRWLKRTAEALDQMEYRMPDDEPLQGSSNPAGLSLMINSGLITFGRS